jgi:hypothetical protein
LVFVLATGRGVDLVSEGIFGVTCPSLALINEVGATADSLEAEVNGSGALIDRGVGGGGSGPDGVGIEAASLCTFWILERELGN